MSRLPACAETFFNGNSISILTIFIMFYCLKSRSAAISADIVISAGPRQCLNDLRVPLPEAPRKAIPALSGISRNLRSVTDIRVTLPDKGDSFFIGPYNLRNPAMISFVRQH